MSNFQTTIPKGTDPQPGETFVTLSLLSGMGTRIEVSGYINQNTASLMLEMFEGNQTRRQP